VLDDLFLLLLLLSVLFLRFLTLPCACGCVKEGRVGGKERSDRKKKT